MDNATRVLLLGKTKAGKSSFINYFLGKEVAETGAGLPITPDFKSYEVTGGKYTIHIFDSRGIEAFEASNQADQIIKELKEKNNSENVFDWFHTIFYCVSMNNSCFEDFEANFIKNLRKQLSQHIHIILTKCDGANDNQISEMRKTIERKLGSVENVKIFEVVSVSKVKRNGTVVQPRGKEAISEQVFQLLLEDIAGKISPRYAAKLHKSYISTAKQYLDWVNEEIDKAVNLKNIIKIFYDEGIEELETGLGNIIEKLENKWQDVQKQVDREFNEIMRPISELYFSYRGIITGSFIENANMLFDDADQWINYDWMDNMDEEIITKKLLPKFGKYLDDDDYDNQKLSYIFEGIISVIGDLISIKKNLKKFALEIYNEYISYVPDEKELQKNAYNRIIEVMTQ